MTPLSGPGRGSAARVIVIVVSSQYQSSRPVASVCAVKKKPFEVTTRHFARPQDSRFSEGSEGSAGRNSTGTRGSGSWLRSCHHPGAAGRAVARPELQAVHSVVHDEVEAAVDLRQLVGPVRRVAGVRGAGREPVAGGQEVLHQRDRGPVRLVEAAAELRVAGREEDGRPHRGQLGDGGVAVGPERAERRRGALYAVGRPQLLLQPAGRGRPGALRDEERAVDGRQPSVDARLDQLPARARAPGPQIGLRRGLESPWR